MKRWEELDIATKMQMLDYPDGSRPPFGESTTERLEWIRQLYALEYQKQYIQDKGTNEMDKEALWDAIELVKSGKVKRIDVDDKVSVYRAGNVVRVDIKD